VWVSDDLAPPKTMQLREAGIVDPHSWIVNPKSGEQVGSWELIERMEKTYGQPAVAILWKNLLNILSEALPDDCKHMGYKCLDVSQVKRSFLSFVLPFSFPGHIRCPTFVFCLHIYNSHLLFLVWHILLLSASVFFLLSPLKMFDCFDPITSLTLFELSTCELKACTHS
jgi:hypothetical protein